MRKPGCDIPFPKPSDEVTKSVKDEKNTKVTKKRTAKKCKLQDITEALPLVINQTGATVAQPLATSEADLTAEEVQEDTV